MKPDNATSPRSSEAWFNVYDVLLVIAVIALIVVAVYVSRINTSINEMSEGEVWLPPPHYTAPNLSERNVSQADVTGLSHQTVYVPTNSHVYSSGGRPFLQETTLEIRNTDEQERIYITRVDYFDSTGGLKQKFIESPIYVKPMETLDFLIPQRDTAGGSGANFLVTWAIEEGANEPFVEAVMTGRSGSYMTSFVRQAVAVRAR